VRGNPGGCVTCPSPPARGRPRGSQSLVPEATVLRLLSAIPRCCTPVSGAGPSGGRRRPSAGRGRPFFTPARTGCHSQQAVGGRDAALVGGRAVTHHRWFFWRREEGDSRHVDGGGGLPAATACCSLCPSQQPAQRTGGFPSLHNHRRGWGQHRHRSFYSSSRVSEVTGCHRRPGRPSVLALRVTRARHHPAALPLLRGQPFLFHPARLARSPFGRGCGARRAAMGRLGGWLRAVAAAVVLATVVSSAYGIIKDRECRENATVRNGWWAWCTSSSGNGLLRRSVFGPVYVLRPSVGPEWVAYECTANVLVYFGCAWSILHVPAVARCLVATPCADRHRIPMSVSTWTTASRALSTRCLPT